jgi:hypothetical protein
VLGAIGPLPDLPSLLQMTGPELPEYWKHLVMPYDRHRLERIVEIRSAFATHFMAVAVDGEHPAQFRMVTTKSKLQSIR